jgi:gp16 family phage-associated protein
MKTTEEVRADMARRGVTAAAWARKNGVAPETVRGVLLGRIKGRSGEAHKVAVLLGIKDGEIVEECNHE